MLKESFMLSNRTTVRIRSVGVIAVVALGLAVGLSGCGVPNQSTVQSQPSPQATEVNPAGDIPDNQAYVGFTSQSGAYSLKVPEGWARTSTASSTSFTDKLNSITAVESANPVAPTVESVRNTDVAVLQGSKTKFELRDVTTFQRPGGNGILVTYRDDSAPNAVTGSVVREDVELYLFWKNGRQVALTLSAPQGSDNVDPWNIVTNSFRWLS
ncbi:MAG: lipoprotein [Cryobacterium sp.]|nr:lipoprotein [Cryobacterium sp.]